MSFCVADALALYAIIAGPAKPIARARKVSEILRREQEPFWLTGGAIGLSNLSTPPPSGAQWWMAERLCFVFVRGVNARFFIDAHTRELIWENASSASVDASTRSSSSSTQGNCLTGRTAAEILWRLFATDRRYSQLVSSFSSLSLLENEFTFLQSLKTEADQALAEQQRTQELQKARERALEGRQTRFDSSATIPPGSTHSAGQKASWDSLIIPQSLRETLQAYCRILRHYKGYQEAGVHLPKGLLFHGPPGCGKTQIAKTLSHEAGLSFVALSTSDCKQMWIGWSADRLAKVFTEARAKQPSLIFIDEIDAVCPIRGAYHDSMSQEFTAQLLQEIDGLLSDTQAIFLVAATNRPDQVDAAILSRFAEQIEIPLPDATTRAALLELFLRPLRFSGDKTCVTRRLALSTAGKSGRDLRAVVNQAVLAGVKRTSSPQNFALADSDFALCSSS